MKGVYRGRRPRRRSGRRLAVAGLEPGARLIVSLAVLVAILAGGTVGYVLLGLSAQDALYQAVITISTVGFGDPEDIGSRYQLFTILLILLGTGTSLYTIGVVIEMLFEGRLDDHIRRRRMQHFIDNLRGHCVICGFGQVGRAITAAMAEAGTEVVVIDRDRDIDAGDIGDVLLVAADATDDRTLRDAGIERAGSMVLALDSDADNLYVALSARALCPSLFIVARANSAAAVPKLHQAGADRVINPHQFGGARMAAIALRPGLTDYYGEVMQRADQDVRLVDHRIAAGSRLVGRSLSDVQLSQNSGCAVAAIRSDGRWLTDPPDDHRLAADDLLVMLGTQEQLSLALAILDPDAAPSD